MTAPAPAYEFDEAFQRKIVALIVRDAGFNRRTQGLIRPEFFDDTVLSCLVNEGLGYYTAYSKTPAFSILVKLLKDGIDAKRIPAGLDFKDTLKALRKEDISDRDYVVDEVARFAKHQAIAKAIYESVDHLDTRNFDAIAQAMKAALDVGANSDFEPFDYFEDIDVRTTERLEIASGKRKRDGITTGMHLIDEMLYHMGWGRRELSLIMGAAKAGKTMSLLDFALKACLAAYNVLYVSLEVSAEIIGDRLDANLAAVRMSEITSKIRDIEGKVRAVTPKAGVFKINDFPTGSFSPSDLKRLIAWYESRSIKFDLIVVDYADIMAPDHWMSEERGNLKQIYIDLRGIACERTAPDDQYPAMLSATQTNREGARATVAKATDVAEDFNKVRTADLVISINATDEEMAMNEARLFFAASRNQAGGVTIRIKQDRERMRFIERVIGKE